jgi:large subunit ribosomal protein L31
MKEKIHPEYYPEAKVTCSCGNVFEVGSTQKDIKTEICSKCHPFYTGKQKILDTAGRVEKFKQKYGM